MITTIAHFKLGKETSIEEARQLFLQSAPDYRTTEGLVRKYYILAEDGRSAGAVYLWKSKEAALNAHTPEWRRRLQDKYGSEPALSFYQSPIIVDNHLDMIIED